MVVHIECQRDLQDGTTCEGELAFTCEPQEGPLFEESSCQCADDMEQDLLTWKRTPESKRQWKLWEDRAYEAAAAADEDARDRAIDNAIDRLRGK